MHVLYNLVLSPHDGISLERQLRRPRHVNLAVRLSPLDLQVPPRQRHRALAVRKAGEDGGDDQRAGARAARLSDAAPSLPNHHLHVPPVQNLRGGHDNLRRKAARAGGGGGVRYFSILSVGWVGIRGG